MADHSKRIAELQDELRTLRRQTGGIGLETMPTDLMTPEQHRLCGCGAGVHAPYLDQHQLAHPLTQGGQ